MIQILATPLLVAQCTLRACAGNELQNRERVDDFEQEYGKADKTFECFHDPWDIGSGAVLRAVLPGWEVFHTIFWPALAVALGLAACASTGCQPRRKPKPWPSRKASRS